MKGFAKALKRNPRKRAAIFFLFLFCFFKRCMYWDTWVPQLDWASAFGSGHHPASWEGILHQAPCSAGSYLLPPPNMVAHAHALSLK